MSLPTTSGWRVPHNSNAAVCGIHPVNDAVFVLDVGNSFCYPGSGQAVRNFTKHPADGSVRTAYDFDLGYSSATDAADPRFVGVPGDCAAFFDNKVDHAGFALQLAGAQTAFLNAMHKAGSKFTVEAWIETTDDTRPGTGSNPLLDTGGADAGGVILVNSVSYCEFGSYTLTPSEHAIRVNTNSGSPLVTQPLNKSADAGIVAHQVTMLACSIDGTGAVPSFLYKNGAYDPSGGQDTWDGTFFSPSTDDTPNKATINGRADALNCSPRTRLYLMRVYNRPLSKAELDANWEALRVRWGI